MSESLIEACPAQYDYAQRLSDLCGAWDSQQRPIAAEILNQIAREVSRTDVLEETVRHVLRYGKQGKKSRSRLKAALKAVEISRG